MLGKECASLPTRAICPLPGHQPSLPLPAPEADSLDPRFPRGLKSDLCGNGLQPHIWGLEAGKGDQGQGEGSVYIAEVAWKHLLC